MFHYTVINVLELSETADSYIANLRSNDVNNAS